MGVAHLRLATASELVGIPNNPGVTNTIPQILAKPPVTKVVQNAATTNDESTRLDVSPAPTGVSVPRVHRRY
jgi:hypothetical protein